MIHRKYETGHAPVQWCWFSDRIEIRNPGGLYGKRASASQDAQKPMFDLRPADGAIGAHMEAVVRCREDFEALCRSLLGRVALFGDPAAAPPGQ